ncbi:hypothetical protein F4604DRAFT_1934260 [Suillus subluteus]|nr:hypothetical protein F4604DRAFT_1934260 [Suillus subluteus]
MPPLRPLPRRRSARLQALDKPSQRSRRSQRTIDKMQGPVTRGRGGKSRHARSPTAGSGSDLARIQIHWLSAPSRTQKVIDHLIDHSADCRVLFYSDSKNSHTEGDHPSGKDKVSICAVIANLRKKYCECYDKLHATGAGIMPQDEDSAENLHAQILKDFHWYNNLVSIMGGNPAISLKMVSSCPGVDHAANYFSISCTAGTLYSESMRSGSAQFGTHPQPASAHSPTSGAQSYPPTSGTQSYSPTSGAQSYSPAFGAESYSPASGAQSYPPASGAQSYPPASGAQSCPPASGAKSYPPPSSTQQYSHHYSGQYHVPPLVMHRAGPQALEP